MTFTRSLTWIPTAAVAALLATPALPVRAQPATANAASNAPAREATDPAGPATGTKRVVRGGSWHSTGDGWRASARRDYAPDYSGISVGMRLVMTAE